MAFVRTWTSQTLRAAAAAVLLPVALLVTLALAVATAGLGGLASLGQLVSGPQLDSAYLGFGGSAASARGAAADPGLPRIPAAPLATGVTANPPARSFGSNMRVRRPAPGQVVRPAPRSGRGRVSPGSSPPGSVQGPGAVQPPASEGLVHRVGGALQRTLAPVAGQTVAGTVGSLVNLVAPKGSRL